MPPAEVVTAIAPPARQTKSAECAPTTSMRRLTSRPASRRDCPTTISWISSSPNPAPSRWSAQSASPSSTSGYPGCRSRWRESVRPSVARTPSKTCSKVVLPLCGVLRQRSSRQPFSARATCSSIERFCAGNSGCVTTIVSTPSSSGAVDDREDVLAAEVPGGEDQPVARDRAEHRPRLREQRAVVAARPHGLDRETEAAQLVLELGPERHLRRPASARSGPPSRARASTVGSQTMRAPSRAAISTASAFIPPTARFSVIVPIPRAGDEPARRPCARSAVEV